MSAHDHDNIPESCDLIACFKVEAMTHE